MINHSFWSSLASNSFHHILALTLQSDKLRWLSESAHTKLMQTLNWAGYRVISYCIVYKLKNPLEVAIELTKLS